MSSYYNEIDAYAAQWLRNLIAAGRIAPGVVDERSIEDVHSDDLRDFTQCHFFAGIGVWSLALRRAGWPDDRPVWTGSCPCQPFSAAGAGAGFDDQRHLWPHFHWLIQECHPPVVIGEQVASKDANPWIDLVQDDLEAMGYGVGAVAFPSAGVGAPHIRDRLYWVGHAGGARLERHARNDGATRWQRPGGSAAAAGVFGGMGHTNVQRAGRNAGAICSTLAREDGQHRRDDAGTPSSVKALMRKHRIWIEHSELLEDDEPPRELRAVQAEQHQFEAFVQDLIALAATPAADAPAFVVLNALLQAEAALEVATARILKADPGHSISVTSEAKALVAVRAAMAAATAGHIADAGKMVAAPAPMVDMTPPATSRDRWMYEQGRLAERDARTHGITAEAAPVVLPEPVCVIDCDQGGFINWLGKTHGQMPTLHGTKLLAEQDVRALLAAAPADPLDWPLPCDVTVGHVTMRKGVALRALVLRMKGLFEMAHGVGADEVAARTPEQRAQMLASFQALTAAPARPAEGVLADGMDGINIGQLQTALVELGVATEHPSLMAARLGWFVNELSSSVIRNASEWREQEAAHPAPAPAADAQLLDFLRDQCIDLRCFSTSDGEDMGWRTVQHHMGEPRERVVSEVCSSDEPRRAIREAMARIERDPYCTGPLHLEDDAISAQAAQKGDET